MIEEFAVVFLRQAFPIKVGCLQHTEDSHYVRLGESERIFDRAVYVRLGGEMDDAVDFLFLHKGVNRVEITDVGLFETI